MGRAGMTAQSIAPSDVALRDMNAKRAGLPLAKLLGAHRDSNGTGPVRNAPAARSNSSI